MSVETNGRKISREDVQAAFARAIGQGEEAARSTVPRPIVLIGAAALAVLALAYLLGRRGGRSESAIVEIRRI